MNRILIDLDILKSKLQASADSVDAKYKTNIMTGMTDMFVRILQDNKIEE